MKVPTEGRILILCSQHANDLLEQDVAFATRYNNTETGKIGKIYSFDIYESPLIQKYATAGTKKDYDAASASTDLSASIAFYAPICMRAQGTTQVFIDEPTAEYQENGGIVQSPDTPLCIRQGQRRSTERYCTIHK